MHMAAGERERKRVREGGGERRGEGSKERERDKERRREVGGEIIWVCVFRVSIGTLFF